MTTTRAHGRWTFYASCVLVLWGCGTSTSTSLSGVAATGAAFDGATVTVTDAKGIETACGVTQANTGAYQCTLAATATAPFVIQAVRTDSAGNTEALYSVVSAATDGLAKANITPLTTAIVSALSMSGDPANFKQEVQQDKTLASATQVAVQVAVLQAQLQPVIDAIMGGGELLNPLTGALTANSGTGMDKLLDSVHVATVPGTATVASQVSISLRANPEAVLTLVKGQTQPATVISASQVSAVQATLDATPAALLASLQDRMNTCYGLALNVRVSKTDGTGMATDVAADACKSLFTQNNPALYKNGGNGVGAKAAFKTLFLEAATGARFDRANLAYVVQNPGKANNGFWVVTYRSTDAAGNVSYGTWALSLEGGVLKHSGNQYDYDTGVSAFMQYRDFIHNPSANYLSTGYSLNVTNKAVNGSSIYKQVMVTSPNGRVFILKPLSGCSYLGLYNGTKVSCTNAVRLSWVNAIGEGTSVPATDAANLFFASTPWTETELATVAEFGKWTYSIELAADNGATPIVQTHRAISRALTMAETKRLKFADLTEAMRAQLVTQTQALGYVLTESAGLADISADNAANAWTVPAGAVAPGTVSIYGNAPQSTGGVWGSGFNDSVSVAASARVASISCSRQSTADMHCASGIAVGGTGNYASAVRVNELQFNAATSQGQTLSRQVLFALP